MTKRIVLCADDYGQAQEISQGIIQLLKMGRLTAVSCLVTSPFWPKHAEWVAPFCAQADLGLHFNLTQGRPLSSQFIEKYGPVFPSLTKLMYQSMLRQLDQKIIEAELLAQIEAFTKLVRFTPYFIDGHQHVHQFPVIRDAIMAVYNSYGWSKMPYIRLVKFPFKPLSFVTDYKKIIVQLMGSAPFEGLLLKYNIPHNLSFSGMYAFARAKQYPQKFPQFLAEIGDKGLIMCHPGMPASDNQDVISAARVEELAYLASPQFLVDCEAQQVTLIQFK